MDLLPNLPMRGSFIPMRGQEICSGIVCHLLPSVIHPHEGSGVVREMPQP